MTSLIRESSWTGKINVQVERRQPKQGFYLCDIHDDRRKERLPDEEQEAKNVIPHLTISVFQQLIFPNSE